MTTTIDKTTEYQVTFHWTASDWDNSTDENGEYDYANQPNEVTQCTVTLPTDATPWDVYCAADKIIGDKPDTADGIYGWDGDGITVEYANTSRFLSGEKINQATKWTDLN